MAHHQSTNSFPVHTAEITTQINICDACDYDLNHINDDQARCRCCGYHDTFTAEEKAAKKARFATKAREAEKMEQWVFKSRMLSWMAEEEI